MEQIKIIFILKTKKNRKHHKQWNLRSSYQMMGVDIYFNMPYATEFKLLILRFLFPFQTDVGVARVQMDRPPLGSFLPDRRRVKRIKGKKRIKNGAFLKWYVMRLLIFHPLSAKKFNKFATHSQTGNS